MPVEDEPLMRWQKQRAAAGQTWKGLVEFAAANQGYLDEVLDQVRQRPLAPAELVDPRPRDGAVGRPLRGCARTRLAVSGR